MKYSENSLQMVDYLPRSHAPKSFEDKAGLKGWKALEKAESDPLPKKEGWS